MSSVIGFAGRLQIVRGSISRSWSSRQLFVSPQVPRYAQLNRLFSTEVLSEPSTAAAIDVSSPRKTPRRPKKASTSADSPSVAGSSSANGLALDGSALDGSTVAGSSLDGSDLDGSALDGGSVVAGSSPAAPGDLDGSAVDGSAMDGSSSRKPTKAKKAATADAASVRAAVDGSTVDDSVVAGSSVDDSAESSQSALMRADWKRLGLSDDVIQALAKSHSAIESPTSIQSQVIPAVLKRQNVMFAAQTGTGKTLAYLLPLVQQMRQDEFERAVKLREKRPRALVLVPNRELADQVLAVAKSLSHYCKFRSVAISGGAKEAPQKRAFEKPVDLLVATPGRLVQLNEQDNVRFTDVRHVVVDEADTMFQDDFAEDLSKIFLPIQGRIEHDASYVAPTQFVVVSATMPKSIIKAIDGHFPNIRKVLDTKLHTVVNRLKQDFVHAPLSDKHAPLLKALRAVPARKTIVFCNTVDSCRSTDYFLVEQGYRTACYHGDILPKPRDANWETFVSGHASVLVCTDIASRGLDTTAVEHVVLFDFPRTPIDYLHRVGRTARAGTKGRVTALVTKRDQALATAIQEAIKNNVSLEGLDVSKIIEQSRAANGRSSGKAAPSAAPKPIRQAGQPSFQGRGSVPGKLFKHPKSAVPPSDSGRRRPDAHPRADPVEHKASARRDTPSYPGLDPATSAAVKLFGKKEKYLKEAATARSRHGQSRAWTDKADTPARRRRSNDDDHDYDDMPRKGGKGSRR
eukprot:TRINITY_DN7353_c0_g1_i1.p1 TRINITY_DN7353_c0_g1~~TRINITY_DN7353_c0_g1_i1.p1  ORF type:complete len:744 (+),score=249.24 TRINITY_DN7353_c0_g1_i1:92-2323(+)